MKLLLSSLLLLSATAALGQDYSTYINQRFGLSVRYPSSFVAQAAPTNDDGREFVSADGAATLSVFGHYTEGEIGSSYNDALAQAESEGQIGYSKLASTWFVVSHIDNATNKVVYEKDFVGPKSHVGFRLSYPIEQRLDYDASVVPVVEKSFHQIAWLDYEPTNATAANHRTTLGAAASNLAPAANGDISRGAGGMTLLGPILLVALSVLFYFVPTIVARRRNHNDFAAIFVLNFLLGWTMIVWIVALVWAFTGNVQRDVHIHADIRGLEPRRRAQFSYDDETPVIEARRHRGFLGQD